MPRKTEYREGQYNFECSVCGHYYKSGIMRKDPNSKRYVCSKPGCYDEKIMWYYMTPPVRNDPKPARHIQGPDSIDLVFTPVVPDENTTIEDNS